MDKHRAVVIDHPETEDLYRFHVETVAGAVLGRFMREESAQEFANECNGER